MWIQEQMVKSGKLDKPLDLKVVTAPEYRERAFKKVGIDTICHSGTVRRADANPDHDAGLDSGSGPRSRPGMTMEILNG